MGTRDRGRRNTNERGSSHARRARKLFLLNRDGDGTEAPCWECGTIVTFATMIVDRIIPGHLGGTYRRNNIRIHCSPCSARSGAALTNAILKALSYA
jgi:5-methylcytosine-specific restriction endonuclease McrA